MKVSSDYQGENGTESPVLIVPYMWIGDFVRVHSVVRLLKARWPRRPIDIQTSALCAPILDYLPGVRKGIVVDLPRRRLPLRRYWHFAQQLRQEHYGTVLVMPRTWKSALAPFLAGIPERTGFAGEGRFGLVNDLRWGERRLERMIDCFGALALPKGAVLPKNWPLPQIEIPAAAVEAWKARQGLAATSGRIVTFAPGAVGPGKAWPPAHYAQLAKRLTDQGISVWVLGGPNETGIARMIAGAGGPLARDLTSNDLRNAIIALKAADAAVTNDSGLMHIAAAIGTPTVAIFGPTSPRLWAPLNPLAAVLEPPGTFPDIKARSTAGVAIDRVHDAVVQTLAALPPGRAAATTGPA
jgi:heptosyltransferase-2